MVPESVVDDVEMVKVTHAHTDPSRVGRGCEAIAQKRRQRCSVGQPRQLVGRCQLCEAHLEVGSVHEVLDEGGHDERRHGADDEEHLQQGDGVVGGPTRDDERPVTSRCRPVGDLRDREHREGRAAAPMAQRRPHEQRDDGIREGVAPDLTPGAELDQCHGEQHHGERRGLADVASDPLLLPTEEQWCDDKDADGVTDDVPRPGVPGSHVSLGDDRPDPADRGTHQRPSHDRGDEESCELAQGNERTGWVTPSTQQHRADQRFDAVAGGPEQRSIERLTVRQIGAERGEPDSGKHPAPSARTDEQQQPQTETRSRPER